MYSPALHRVPLRTLKIHNIYTNEFLFCFFCIQLDSARGYPKSFSLISCRLNSV